MTVTTCKECLERADLDTEECLACPRFMGLFADAKSSDAPEAEIKTTGFRAMQMIGTGIAGAGAIAGIQDLPVIAVAMMFFGFGIWLAGVLSTD